ncbi:MAG: NAD-dependent epimerase/dehydratase family protein [bacterium]|nr:NAD-dependent epimerase/dehydratase family protein [bacterium]
MRVLVTGANGFIGQWVCRALADGGIAVRGAVRSADVQWDIPHGAARSDRAVVGALSDRTDWGVALRGVDSVVHLAARVHVMRERADDPLAAFRAVNVDATVHLARSAAARGVRRFVYVSSVKVLGERTVTRPFTEQDVPYPRDPYAQSKWEAEEALAVIAEKTGLELVIVRSPLVYGPGVGGNFFHLLRLVDRGVPLPIAHIANERSMIGVRNLADVLRQCVMHPCAAGERFLVRDTESVSTPELIRRLAAALGRRPRLWPCPRTVLMLLAAVTGRRAALRRLTESLAIDGTHVCATLGWVPPVAMEEELRATVAGYRRFV